jgi:cysteine desulfurase
VITSLIEHKSVLEPLKTMARKNLIELTFLPVNYKGEIILEELEKAIQPTTFLVSIQSANNEIGTIQNLKEISLILKSKNILFHSDITQSLSTEKLDMNELGVDLASFSSHKIYGPKGVGALYVKTKSPRIKISPLFFGGGQEKDLKPGTQNIPAIVGFGKACEIALQKREEDHQKLSDLKKFFIKELQKRIPDLQINGAESGLPQNISLTFKEKNSEELLKNLPTLALSTGAACNNALLEPSHVLRAIGLSEAQSFSTLRFGLGRQNTKEEIQSVITQIQNLI